MCGHGRSQELSSYANQTKRDMTNALHFYHSQSPVVSTKRWKEYLQPDVNLLLGDEQEGIRNSTRLLDRLHLTLENAKHSRLPTAMININLEMAFESVWIDGLLFKLLEHNFPALMYRMIESFL